MQPAFATNSCCVRAERVNKKDDTANRDRDETHTHTMKLIHQQRAEARIGHKFCCSPTDHDCVAVPLSAMLPLLVLGTQNLGTRRECNLKTQATMLTITRTARKHCTRARYTLHTYTATHTETNTLTDVDTPSGDGGWGFWRTHLNYAQNCIVSSGLVGTIVCAISGTISAIISTFPDTNQPDPAQSSGREEQRLSPQVVVVHTDGNNVRAQPSGRMEIVMATN